MKMTGQIYAQHLITSQVNYTCGYLGDKIVGLSADKVERYIKSAKFTAGMLWDKAKTDLVPSEQGAVIFDDTVLSHKDSTKMELVYKQWSGAEHAVVKGIGIVVCLYHNPESDMKWIIDYRIYDIENDGKTKVQLAMDMYLNFTLSKRLNDKPIPFKYILFDAAYAHKHFIALINDAGHFYLTNMKGNRKCTEVSIEPAKQVQIVDLDWEDEHSLNFGKVIRLKDYPKGRNVKVFSIAVQTDRIDYIVTNDFSLDSSIAAYEVSRIRWSIECFNRELKQVTGIKKCHCRKLRSQRTHIHLALLAWLYLKRKAIELKTTVYQLKEK
jgi:hypothetical protein